MKRLLSFIVLLLCSVVTTFAQLNGIETDDQGVKYEQKGEVCYVWGFDRNSTVTSITIPEKYKGFPVRGIDNNAFSGCTGITSVSIPNTVWSIGEKAFFDCSGLTYVQIPSSVEYINGFAFANCTGFRALTIPSSVKTIGESAFAGCEGLDLLTIENGVQSIGPAAFYNCDRLGSVTVPSSVTYLGHYAFQSCDNLTSVHLPSSLTMIDEGTFAYCSNLPTITIPTSVTEIGATAFQYCLGLKSITIPSNVKSIGDAAFRYCSGLTSLTIENGLTSIGDYAFWNCTSLTSVILPSSMKILGEGAFRGCSSMTSITIPEGVTEIGEQAFMGCIELTSLHFPSSVTSTSLGPYAFSGMSKLTSITLPPCITEIDIQSFEGCSSLMSVTIPSSVTSIGEEAFRYCGALTSLTIPESVTSIGEEAFSYCGDLVSVTIPSSVSSIGKCAFLRCYDLASVTVGRDTPLALNPEDDIFYNVPLSKAVLFVPKGTKAAYRAADVWKDFKMILEVGTSLAEIDETSTVAPEAVDNAYVTVKRLIYAEEWSTLCLPFAMSAEQVKTAFGENVKLGDFAGCEVNGDNITVKFDKATSIAANHPYIIKVPSTVSEFTVEGVDISPAAAEVKKNGGGGKYNSFIGNYENGLTLADGTLFLKDNYFWFSNGNTKMKGLRGYFRFDAAGVGYSPSSRIAIQYDDATGVSDTKRETTADRRYYNLSGQQVDTPAKGIYVRNRKKVIIQ